MYTIYCYPRCGTCKKAVKYLEEKGIQFNYVDIVEETPSKNMLKSFFEMGDYPLKRFFNTSGMKYRDMKLKDKVPTMSETEVFDLLSGEGMLIKRPMITDNKGILLVGFRESEWDEKIK